MTGAELGGCAIALAPSQALDDMFGSIRREFSRRGHGAPRLLTVTPSDGARRVA